MSSCTHFLRGRLSYTTTLLVLFTIVLGSFVSLTFAANGSTSEVVLYDFGADYCKWCHVMEPVIKQMESEGYSIRKVNTEQEPELAERYHVQGLPCFVVVADGKEVGRLEGKRTKAELQNLMRLGAAAASSLTSPATKASSDASRGQFIYTPDSPRQSVTSSGTYNNGSSSIQMVVGANATERPRLGPSSNGQLVELEQPSRTGFVPNGPSANSSNQLISSSGRDLNYGHLAQANENTLAANTSTNNNSWPQRGELMESSVRLILSDANSRSFGSGTIIDCRQGEALIVTCGHIFRDWSERSRITVDMFGPNAEQQVPGRVLMHDLKSDVAIVAIQVQRPVRAAHVAKEGTKIQKGEPALAIGCEHGQDVAVFPTKVTNIDKYLGPPNLQIAGQPQQGRSGGGLFNRNGDLIGICNGAIKEDNEGLYAGLTAVHQLLDKAQLAFVYRTETAPPKFDRELERITSQEPPQMPTRMPLMNREDQFARNDAVRTDFEVARDPNEQLDPRMASAQPAMSATREFAPNGTPIASASNVNQSPVSNQFDPNTVPNKSANADNSNALLNQAITQNRSNQEAEVICIVRPRDSRQAHGTVVVLEHASPEFLAKLEAEKSAQQQRTGNTSTQQPSAPLPYALAPSSTSAPAVIPVSASGANVSSANLLPTTESRHIPTGTPIAWPMR